MWDYCENSACYDYFQGPRCGHCWEAFCLACATEHTCSESPAKAPVLYIMRGIPGSGKSTLSKQIATSTKGASEGLVCSTDDFFLDVDGKYVFNPTKLGEAHPWNQKRAEDGMRAAMSPVLIDNTNTQQWEAKPYFALAVKYGYRVLVAEPQTEWRRDPVRLTEKNSHGVPEEAIKRMLSRWEEDFTVKSVLASKPPRWNGGGGKKAGGGKKNSESKGNGDTEPTN